MLHYIVATVQRPSGVTSINTFYGPLDRTQAGIEQATRTLATEIGVPDGCVIITFFAPLDADSNPRKD